MSVQSRLGREKLPLGMLFWFIASLVGLWVIIRNGDPSQIPEGWIFVYLLLAAINFITFDCGWYLGGMFRQWWASYIFVFIAAAFVPIAFWWLWWFHNIIIPSRLPSKLFFFESELLKSNAITMSNLAAALFVVLILPACCGVYFRQRKA